MATRMSVCPICQCAVRASRLHSHMRKVHDSKVAKSPLRPVGAKRDDRESVEASFKASVKNRASKRSKRSKLLLDTKRAKRIDESSICDECCEYVRVVWRYSYSNRGPVKLCTSCRAAALDWSFGKLDALDYAWSGGAVEMNRRRH
jgi:hypothetical protein